MTLTDSFHLITGSLVEIWSLSYKRASIPCGSCVWQFILCSYFLFCSSFVHTKHSFLTCNNWFECIAVFTYHLPFFILTVHFSLSKMCKVQSILITVVNNWWLIHKKMCEGQQSSKRASFWCRAVCVKGITTSVLKNKKVDRDMFCTSYLCCPQACVWSAQCSRILKKEIEPLCAIRSWK